MMMIDKFEGVNNQRQATTSNTQLEEEADHAAALVVSILMPSSVLLPQGKEFGGLLRGSH